MEDYADLLAPWATARPVLERREPKILAGVCQGLAQHLGGSVRMWRLAFLLLCWTVVPVVVYAVLALTLSREGADVSTRRLVKPLASGEDSRPTTAVALGAMGVIILLVIVGYFPGALAVLPLALILAGGAIAWSVQGRWASLALGVGLLVATMGAVVVVKNVVDSADATTAFLTGFAALAVGAFVLYPSQMRSRMHAREQDAQLVREETRADIAAHLHDSVLQTLALIRSRADDADAVRVLARQQEAELRDYLYSDRRDDTSVATVLTRRAREVEATYGAQVDVVITGDMEVTARTQALIDAAGEALTNACKHGGSPISMYAELGDGGDVWVRDRGEGFDVGSICEDRRGVRHSIYGRMERAGGRANIRSPLPTGGTEVHMSVEEEQ
ncbi:ATP-binding protein [Trueperella bernardiae]|uniref:ATP-binding protein n=1 Tax=Trueperella bernardiae TaxID=59561 RepID=UPI002043374D|nr:ATP-binding protein [Trueperella bernardiae]MCM3906537.1 PspC domain-containing protein [Trueperella bernardiae]